MSVEQTERHVIDDFRFEDLTPIAFVEVDRYCENCGYNLRTQAIRREPRTQVLLTRCPECGRFHPAADGASAARVWLRRLSSLLFVIWAGIILSMLAMFFVGAGGISYGTVADLTTYQRVPIVTSQPASRPAARVNEIRTTINSRGVTTTTQWRYVRSVRPLELEDRLFIALTLAGSFALDFVAALAIVVVLHHWRRWICVLVMVAGTLVTAAIVAAAWRHDAPDLFWWGLRYICAHTFLQIAGCVTGVVFGRYVARGLVRVFVPTSWRAPLAYLWLIDGKTPPGTADA